MAGKLHSMRVKTLGLNDYQILEIDYRTFKGLKHCKLRAKRL